jgi:hypothetical protein
MDGGRGDGWGLYVESLRKVEPFLGERRSPKSRFYAENEGTRIEITFPQLLLPSFLSRG